MSRTRDRINMDENTRKEVQKIIQEELFRFMKSDRYIFEKLVKLAEAKNIEFGTATGTRIGTTTTQKIGFWNTTPVIQQAHIGDPSGGGTVDSQSRAAIIDILTLLETEGLMAP